MNDIKRAERARMGQRNLRNLMIWHHHGKARACKDVPVMAILKEFRAMARLRGRQAHRAQPTPTYEYEREASHRMASTSAGTSQG